MGSPEKLVENILVVDDNDIKRYTTCRSLERAGYNVIQTTNGAEALELVRQIPDLVVLDVKLPDIGGFEVCRRIKADPETSNILVLHLSAHQTSGPDLAKGLEGGADSYLTVPVEPDVLVATVRALLRLHRAEEEARAAARYWRATFDAISDAVFLIGTDGVLVRGNRAAGTLAGLEPNALIGRPFSGVLADIGLGDFSDMVAACDEASAAEVPFANNRWMRLAVDLVLGSDATTPGMVCTLSDITLRKLAEQERAVMAAKNERIAETLQRSLLLIPGAASFPGIEVDGVYEAAWKESLVGGDFSDVFAMDAAKVALAVGDVTGKGLAAALYTAEIKFALRAFLRESANPARALYRLNHYLIESRRLGAISPGTAGYEPDTYVSLTLAVLDTSSCTVSAAGAGAELPLIIRAADGSAEEMTDAHGPLLAMDENSDYRAAEAALMASDLLLLATDGITEARAPGRGGAFFGLAGMADAARTAKDGTARQIADAIVRAALEFAGGRQHDDICLLAARCTGEPQNG